jgi:hypothetical protein
LKSAVVETALFSFCTLRHPEERSDEGSLPRRGEILRGACPERSEGLRMTGENVVGRGDHEPLSHRDRECRVELLGIFAGPSRLRDHGTDIGEDQEEHAKAIEFHLEGIREEGLPVPSPSSVAKYVEVS